MQTYDDEYVKRLSPIGCLQGNIIHAFEKPNLSTVDRLRKASEDGKVLPTIDLLLDQISPRGPFVKRVGSNAQIAMYLTHAEMLWAFIYGWIVLYEESVQKPWMNGEFDGYINLSNDLTKRAAQLLDWAASLRRGYTPWPAELPSPEYSASSEEQDYALKVNGIFQSACAFLLYHEFCHATQGHFEARAYSDTSEESLATAVQLEREADEYAFNALVDINDDEQTRRVKGWAVLAPALSSLYLIGDCSELFQRRHPHLHHRIDEILQRLNYTHEPTRFYYQYLCSTVLTVFHEAERTEDPGNLYPTEFEDADEALRTKLDELDSQRQPD